MAKTGPQPDGKLEYLDGWRITIDGWVRDATIRQHALLALGMLLTTAAVIIGFMSGGIADAFNALLPTMPAKTAASGGVAGLILATVGARKLRTRRRS